MTVCEDEGCVEGSAISPGTVYYVHAFMTSIEVTWIDRTKSYLTHGNILVIHSTPAITFTTPLNLIGSTYV